MLSPVTPRCEWTQLTGLSVPSGQSSAGDGNHDRRHPDQRASAGGRDHPRPGGGRTNHNADQRLAAAAAPEGAQSQGKPLGCNRTFTIKAGVQ